MSATASATVSACQMELVENIRRQWNSEPPTNILRQLEADKPWGVLYSTPGIYPPDIRGVTLDHNCMRIIPKHGDVKQLLFNWSESNGVLSDGTLKWHVLLLAVDVFAFYICDDKGPSGPPQGVVSVALGPPGGLPDETKTTARGARKTFKKLGLNMDYEYDIIMR